MENNHLTYFKVENFKKFESLEVKDIGQFNLIVGDNNVGKTCFLEALLIDEDIDICIENIHNTLCKRNIHIHPRNINSKNPIFPKENYFDFLKHNKMDLLSFKWKTESGEFDYSFEDKSVEELNETDFNKEIKHNYNVGRPNFWVKIYENKTFSQLQFMYLDDFKTKLKHDYQPFINKNAGFDYDLNKYYAEEIGLGENESLGVNDVSDLTTKAKSLSYEEQTKFLNKLSLFFEDIEGISIKRYFERDMLSLKLKRYDDFVPITYFGDGTNEYVRYLLELLKCKNKRIMIDEIDTGIHYSKLKDFWTNILKMCKELDVQLFATTHSIECIESFVQALQESKIEEARVIKLKELDNKEIKAITYPFSEFEYLIKSESEIR